MYYSDYLNFDTSHGEGVRCTLFISGCSRCCQDCFNKQTWDYKYGKEYTQEFEDQLLKDLANPYVKGLSLLGGNPTERKNIQQVIKLCQRVKLELPEKDIWCWSGHTFEELKNNLLQAQCLECITYLVDGKFIKELYEPDLLFRGSLNQRIIDVQKSLTTNKICLYLEGNYK